MSAPDLGPANYPTEPPMPDLDALPMSPRAIASRVRAALAEQQPLQDAALDHDVRCLVGEVLAPSGPLPLPVIAARQVESTGNVVSGYGEHGLATRLWALAADLRERAAKQGGQ